MFTVPSKFLLHRRQHHVYVPGRILLQNGHRQSDTQQVLRLVDTWIQICSPWYYLSASLLHMPIKTNLVQVLDTAFSTVIAGTNEAFLPFFIVPLILSSSPQHLFVVSGRTAETHTSTMTDFPRPPPTQNLT